MLSFYLLKFTSFIIEDWVFIGIHEEGSEFFTESYLLSGLKWEVGELEKEL